MLEIILSSGTADDLFNWIQSSQFDRGRITFCDCIFTLKVRAETIILVFRKRIINGLAAFQEILV
jgi:hypothetical protein